MFLQWHARRDVCRKAIFYHEKTQKHVEKSVCIFISVGGQDILSAPVCACLRALAHRQMRWRTGRCVGAQAGLDPAMPV